MVRQISSDLKEAVFDLLCKNSFPFYCIYKLGLIWEEAYWKLAKDLVENRFILVEMSRKAGKTELVTVAFVLWLAEYHADWVKSICIFSAEQSMAQGKLRRIKDKLENNRALRHLLPYSLIEIEEAKTSKVTRRMTYWHKDGIRLRTGVEINVASFAKRPRGESLQILIMDDVVTENNSRVREGRKKVITDFNAVYVPMIDALYDRTKGSKLISIFTPLYENDLNAVMTQKKRKDGSNAYAHVRYPAVIYNKEAGQDWTAGVPQFPNRLTIAYLQEQLDAMTDEAIFRREYLLELVDSENSIFPLSKLKLGCYANLSWHEPVKDLKVIAKIMGGDFGVFGTYNGDYTAFVLLHVLEDYRIKFHRYLLENNLELDDQLALLEDFIREEMPDYANLEANGFQKIYADAMQRVDELKNMVTINAYKTGKEKHDWGEGIPALRNAICRRVQFMFPFKTEEDKIPTRVLLNQLNSVELVEGKYIFKSEHDDFAMASWLAYRGVRDYLYNGEGSVPVMVSLTDFSEMYGNRKIIN